MSFAQRFGKRVGLGFQFYFSVTVGVSFAVRMYVVLMQSHILHVFLLSSLCSASAGVYVFVSGVLLYTSWPRG